MRVPVHTPEPQIQTGLSFSTSGISCPEVLTEPLVYKHRTGFIHAYVSYVFAFYLFVLHYAKLVMHLLKVGVREFVLCGI